MVAVVAGWGNWFICGDVGALNLGCVVIFYQTGICNFWLESVCFSDLVGVPSNFGIGYSVFDDLGDRRYS
jgi:hypothetical protein